MYMNESDEKKSFGEYIRRKRLEAGLTQKELAGRPDLPRTDVMGAELPPGGCRVQTPEGILDASVDTQLTNLKNLVENQ